MTFEEYQQGGRARYLALVDAIQNILRYALSQHALVAHGITGRAKEIASLKKKLIDRGVALDQSMDEIKDLAGCRIVFLTNSQVGDFKRTGALNENFEVLSVNVHHPVPGTDTETKLFDSTNYLVRLKPDRVTLPEYRQFEGLQAEIQIQTLLNHAWAEMGHDTIYKEPQLTNLGAAQMTEIGKRMNKVMQDHLIPAGHDFDNIAKKFRILVNANDAAPTTIDAIERVDNNNDLANAVKTYSDLVLPHFDNPAEEFSKRLDLLIDAAERSRNFSCFPVVTDFGEYRGKSSLDVVRCVAKLIESHRYVDPKRTFHAVVRLYAGARDHEERCLWVEVGKKLAEYNLDVWKRYRAAVQKIILDELELLDSRSIARSQPLFLAMLSNVLSADLEGTAWRSNSVTFHQHALPASDELRQLRSQAIGWLEQRLDAAEADAERLAILQSLGKACRKPWQTSSDAGSFLMLLEDATRVAKIVLARAPRWSLELRRNREVDALRTHHRFRELPTDFAERKDVIVARKELNDAILGLRDQLAADNGYVLYKTLIGYDSVRPNAWDGDHFDSEATEVWRQERYMMIISELTVETVSEWRARVDDFVDEVSRDSANFAPMREFLELLAEHRPDVALLMLDEVSVQFTGFVSAMLSGLERAGRADEVLTLIDGWMDAGQLLTEIGGYLLKKPEPDVDRLQILVSKAIKLEDQASIVKAAKVAAAWYKGAANAALIKTVFMPAVRVANERQFCQWGDRLFTLGNTSIVQDLDETEAEELLQSFGGIADVDYGIGQILTAVGRRHPQLTINFFSERMRRSFPPAGERFEAIPYDSYGIAELFSPHPELLLSAVRTWYDDEPMLHEYRGGRLLKHTFPELTEEVAGSLIAIARKGNDQDFKFILTTLSAYEGAEQIYPILMEVVDRLEPGDKLLSNVSIVLDKTGVVSGEFGFVEAQKQKLDLIEKYQQDPRPPVQDYARYRARELKQEMASEQRRAAALVAQRRRDWDEE